MYIYIYTYIVQAGIPIAAARFMVIYPVPSTGSLGPAERELLDKACQTELGASLLISGGFGYVNQAGAIIAVNAILKSSFEAPSPHFVFNGPFALTQAACTTLKDRFLPTTWPTLRGYGATNYAWVRPAELTDQGLTGPYGAYAYANDGLSEGCYFRLIPSAVPAANVVVKFVAVSDAAEASLPYPSKPGRLTRRSSTSSEVEKRRVSTNSTIGEVASTSASSSKPGRPRPTSRTFATLNQSELRSYGVDYSKLSSSGSCHLMRTLFPLKTRVADIKSCIETFVGLPTPVQSLFSASGQPMADIAPLDEYLSEDTVTDECANLVINCVLLGQTDESISAVRAMDGVTKEPGMQATGSDTGVHATPSWEQGFVPVALSQ